MANIQRSWIHRPEAIGTLIVGGSRAPEFDEGLAILLRLTDVIEAADLNAAERRLEDPSWCPDLVVLVQDRPGEHALADVARLRRAAPLARFIALVGSWCEGEPRTGGAAPGVIRVYWYDAAARFSESLEKLIAGRCPAWGLPLTAGDDELLLATACEPTVARQGLILLATRHFDSAEALAEACRSRGYSAVWLPSSGQALVHGATAILWDGSVMSASEGEELSKLARRYPTTPVIAVLDFPRFDGRQRALAHGAACAVGRPLVLDDLFWQIAQLAGAETVTAPASEVMGIKRPRIGHTENAA